MKDIYNNYKEILNDMIGYMHTKSIYIVTKHCYNLNELSTLIFYFKTFSYILLLYAYFKNKIRTKYL